MQLCKSEAKLVEKEKESDAPIETKMMAFKFQTCICP